MGFRPVITVPVTQLWECGNLFGTLPDPPGSQSNTQSFDFDDGVAAIFDLTIMSQLVTPTSDSRVEFEILLTLTDGMTTWNPVALGSGGAGNPQVIGAFQKSGGPPFDENNFMSRCSFLFFPGRGNVGDPPGGETLTATLTLTTISGNGSGLVQISDLLVELRQGVLS